MNIEDSNENNKKMIKDYSNVEFRVSHNLKNQSSKILGKKLAPETKVPAKEKPQLPKSSRDPEIVRDLDVVLILITK